MKKYFLILFHFLWQMGSKYLEESMESVFSQVIEFDRDRVNKLIQS